jgi:surfeit locus 1 family protein
MGLAKGMIKRWFFPTIFVIAGVIVLVRLGLWQLDRLQQRRDLNQVIAARWDQEPYNLNQSGLPAQLEALGYRRIEVTGRFDYTQQIALKNQNRETEPGVKLVAPLVLPDGQAILVQRGWIPYAQAPSEQWAQYNEKPGDTTIVGMIQKSQFLPGAKPPATPQKEWFRVDIDTIQQQMTYPLLPVFLIQLPEPGQAYTDLPYREVPFEITEGNHFGYAIQWFMFAVILGGGYLPYVFYQEKRRQQAQAQADGANPDAHIDAPALS